MAYVKNIPTVLHDSAPNSAVNAFGTDSHFPETTTSGNSQDICIAIVYQLALSDRTWPSQTNMAVFQGPQLTFTSQTPRHYKVRGINDASNEEY